MATKKTAPAPKKTTDSVRGRTYSLTVAGKKALTDAKEGQKTLILSTIGSLETATSAQIAEAVEKSGKLETKQPVGRVVSFYLGQFRADGLVKLGAKAKKTTEEAA